MGQTNDRLALKLSSDSKKKYRFFQPKSQGVSKKGGPEPRDQLFSIAKGHDWTVLNAHLLSHEAIQTDDRLRSEVNALKHALQVSGPTSKHLPDLRHNTGKAKGHVYHGHCSHSSGTEYVLEWSEIDAENKIIALIRFGKHENFHFTQSALSPNEISNIQNHEKNQQLLKRVQLKRKEAQEKVARIPLARTAEPGLRA